MLGPGVTSAIFARISTYSLSTPFNYPQLDAEVNRNVVIMTANETTVLVSSLPSSLYPSLLFFLLIVTLAALSSLTDRDVLNISSPIVRSVRDPFCETHRCPRHRSLKFSLSISSFARLCSFMLGKSVFPR